MPISRQGMLNTTALVVADVYTVIVPPQVRLINGQPTDGLAVVGSAAWGPVNKPTIFGSYSQYLQRFGGLRERRHDMGTVIAAAIRQGAQNFVGVRVTDGTDLRAQAAGPAATGAAFYGRYSGSFGNGITIRIMKGGRPATWRAVVSAPGVYPEAFDGLPEVGFWEALERAINQGTDIRGASDLIAFSHGTADSTPVEATYTLAGGTDGADGVTSTTLMGQDGAIRTGVYALRGSKASILVLADFDTVEDWADLQAFTAAESFYGIVAFPAGTSIEDAIEEKQSAGIFDWSLKVMHGDHLLWKNPVSGRIATVSPVGFVAGRLANLSPDQSSLNKPLYGIVGSQRTGLPGSDNAAAYTHAEISALSLAGIDLVCNPAPGGAYWACRTGHNASTDINVQGDNYTRMVNYIAVTLDAAMGVFVGRVVSDELLTEVTATVTTFLSGLQQQGLLKPLNGVPCFSVLCSKSNNPIERLAVGYLQCDVQVRLGPIVERLILNVEAGQGVAINDNDISINRVAA